MNQNLHKLIFNRNLGLMIAVSKRRVGNLVPTRLTQFQAA